MAAVPPPHTSPIPPDEDVDENDVQEEEEEEQSWTPEDGDFFDVMVKKMDERIEMLKPLAEEYEQLAVAREALEKVDKEMSS